MFDISWTEFLLIGVVALIVIGPKELPGVMRTMGQWTRKLRGMASDFQHQFQEAMREAEMADLKKQVDDMAHDIKNYDPLQGVRSDVESIGKDIESSAAAPPAAEPSLPEAAAQLADSNVVGTATGPVTPEAAEQSAAALHATTEAATAEATPSGESAVIAAATAPVAPEPSEEAPQPDSTRRAG